MVGPKDKHSLMKCSASRRVSLIADEQLAVAHSILVDIAPQLGLH